MGAETRTERVDQMEIVRDSIVLEESGREAERPISDGVGILAHPMRAIEAVAAALMAAIIIFILTGVFFRYFLARPLIWIDELVALTFIWMSMLGAVIAIDRGEHVRFTLFMDFIPRRVRPYMQAVAVLLVAIFSGGLILPAIKHAEMEAVMRSVELGIPRSAHIYSIAAGFGLIVALSLVRCFRAFEAKDLGIAVALVAAAGLLFWLVSDTLLSLGMVNIGIFLVGVTLFSLVIGVPIAFCFGIGSLYYLFFATSLPMSVLVGRIDEGMANPVLWSVPVFVLLGCILDRTGMGKAIVDFLLSLIGHVRAGMSYVLLGSLFLVSGISGSKVSDMATVAPALFPEMRRRGNKPSEMIGLLASGVAMADTVPPSIVLIVLGSIAGLSIGALFEVGFAIALVLLVVLMIVARWRAADDRSARPSRAPVRVMGWTFLIAAPALALPFLIRGAVGAGVATATEVSTVAALYTFLAGMFLYGGISRHSIYNILVETASLSGVILLILGTATGMAWVLTQTGFAFAIREVMIDLPGGWVSFMLVSILVFMVLGCLLEGLPALVLLGPIMFPIAASLGIDGIQYGMVAVVAMNIGMFIPPLGVGFYLACTIGKVKPETALHAMWPYLGALIFGAVMIALVPALSTWYK